MVNVLREGIALRKIPEEKEGGNYEGRKKKVTGNTSSNCFC